MYIYVTEVATVKDSSYIIMCKSSLDTHGRYLYPQVYNLHDSH